MNVSALLRAYDLFTSDSDAETAVAVIILAAVVGPVAYSLLTE